jgi:hypothetical protein
MIKVFCKELINNNLQIIQNYLCVNYLLEGIANKDKIVSFPMKLKILIYNRCKINKRKFAYIFKNRDIA